MKRSDAPTSLLSLADVRVAFGARTVLDRVSLDIRQQDFITIVGPNGAGKSTLLKVMLGLQKPTSGMRHQRAGMVVGYVPQRVEIPSSLPLTVARYLALTGTVSPELLTQTGVGELLHYPLHTLSGGERQRVMLVRALIRTPQLLVLDEPTQHLDMAGQLEFYAVLDTIHRETGCAVVMVSHDLHLVMARTNHVVCLYHHICCQGSPESIAQDPAFAGTIGQHAAQLLARYNHPHHHAHGHLHDHGSCEHEH